MLYLILYLLFNALIFLPDTNYIVLENNKICFVNFFLGDCVYSFKLYWMTDLVVEKYDINSEDNATLDDRN